MPKRAVIEYQCERCPRKWYAPPPGDDEAPAQLQLTFRQPGVEDIDVTFEILCEKCTSACLTYVNSIRKERREEEPPTEG